MYFRANEEIEKGYLKARKYLLKDIAPNDFESSENKLNEIIEEYGPVIYRYPTWHPLVSNHDPSNPTRVPSEKCGYLGLDHTVYFRNAFLSCPYRQPEQICDSVKEISKLYSGIVEIEADILDEKFYHSDAKPVLVSCSWCNDYKINDFISQINAIPLMIKNELKIWPDCQHAYSWDMMHQYILGEPCGKESSLFVDRKTGNYLKKTWNLLVDSGMFGAVR